MRQTRLTWQLISTLLGVLFIIWGAITPQFPLLPGDVWLVVPGSLMFVIGVFGIVDDVLAAKVTDSKEEIEEEAAQ